MLLIAYLIGYAGQTPVECCGVFRDAAHFAAFKSVEAHAGRLVGRVLMEKKIDKPDWYPAWMA